MTTRKSRLVLGLYMWVLDACLLTYKPPRPESVSHIGCFPRLGQFHGGLVVMRHKV